MAHVLYFECTGYTGVEPLNEFNVFVQMRAVMLTRMAIFVSVLRVWRKFNDHSDCKFEVTEYDILGCSSHKSTLQLVFRHALTA